MTDAGLAACEDCKNLVAINLCRTQVTDAGLVALASLGTLTSLNLAGTNVTAKGIERLAKALPKCKITWDDGVIGPK